MQRKTCTDMKEGILCSKTGEIFLGQAMVCLSFFFFPTLITFIKYQHSPIIKKTGTSKRNTSDIRM